MSENGFALAADGFVQLTPLGEFYHRGAEVTQVIDRETCDAIAKDFNARKADANFPGVLVNFDHFSLDADKSSEAAGWITDLESRPDGLWAKVRWSDAGLAAVKGGRFRLVSPVFPGVDSCEDLGGRRIRPRSLVSVALTNEPNIKGGRPLSNRQVTSNREKVRGGEEGSRGDAEARSGEGLKDGGSFGFYGVRRERAIAGNGAPASVHWAALLAVHRDKAQARLAAEEVRRAMAARRGKGNY